MISCSQHQQQVSTDRRSDRHEPALVVGGSFHLGLTVFRTRIDMFRCSRLLPAACTSMQDRWQQ